MSPAYVTQLLELIVTTATADSLPLHSLLQDDIIKSLSSDEERPECIQVVLKSFSETPIERIRLYNSNIAYSLDHTRITRWYGLRTLSSIHGYTTTSSFLAKWQSSIPAGITTVPKLPLLIGNYFHLTPTTIQSLPSAELSTIPEHRFAQLFGVKEKWSLDEIMPFLEGCVEGGNGWEKRAERECQKWARVGQGMVMKR